MPLYGGLNCTASLKIQVNTALAASLYRLALHQRPQYTYRSSLHRWPQSPGLHFTSDLSFMSLIHKRSQYTQFFTSPKVSVYRPPLHQRPQCTGLHTPSLLGRIRTALTNSCAIIRSCNAAGCFSTSWEISSCAFPAPAGTVQPVPGRLAAFRHVPARHISRGGLLPGYIKAEIGSSYYLALTSLTI